MREQDLAQIVSPVVDAVVAVEMALADLHGALASSEL